MNTATARNTRQAVAPRQRLSLVKDLDAEIGTVRQELQTLESARAILVGAEPVSRGKGRPARRFQASGSNTPSASTQTTQKRGRGRPKGSKNKPKVAVSEGNKETFANDTPTAKE